jgi:hypothetical protein
MSMQMKDREYRDDVLIHGKEDTVRETAHECSPSAWIDFAELEGIPEDPVEYGVDLSIESKPETRPLALVPKRRLEDLELGFR